MSKTLFGLLVLGGCLGDDSKPPGVVECEQHAVQACAEIGYEGNQTCFLVFAQDCSDEDTELAHAMCCEINSVPLSQPCRLTWR